jgi:signal transduction histidine kinase
MVAAPDLTAPGGPFERTLVRVGVKDHVARLLAATPSLRASWFAAGAIVVGFSARAAAAGPAGLVVFLVVAPLVPVAGVAAAYGPWMDPMYEMAHATPTSGLRILLLRAAAVLATTAVLVGSAAILLPGADWTAAAWVLPSLALTLASIALSTFVPTQWAAAGVTLFWLTVVVVSAARSGDRFAVFHGSGQVAFFVVVVGSSAVLARRRGRLEVEGRARQRQLVDVVEGERRRIERNIHDGAQQQLVAIGVKLGVAKILVESNPVKAVALIEALQAEAKEALDALREMTRGSCPPVLADQGLAAALELKAKKAPIPVKIDAQGLGRFEERLETAVYFCCLEALQNLVKYARATRATVALRSLGRELSFSVSDDGVGFDPDSVSRGVGLRSMSERIEALGGGVEFRSAPGAGTVVLGRVPLIS